MPRLGKLVEWNDARGFGFIAPIDAPHERVFLHIHEYRRMGRRPDAGEVLRFVARRQPDGRWRAFEVARAVTVAHRRGRADVADLRHRRSPTTWLPPVLVVAWLALLAWIARSGALPAAAWVALAALNGITFLAYWRDKRAAEGDRRRTPELTLHLLELLGGWPAAWWAQVVLRHKSRKPAYRAVFLAMAIANLGACVGAAWMLR